MSTPIVTIGGKVVYTTPAAARFRLEDTRASSVSGRPGEGTCQCDRLALAFGLAAVAGLLILLVVWVVAQRGRT